MKKIYLLSERGTSFFYHIAFLSIEKASEKILDLENEATGSYWDVFTLDLNESV